MKFLEIQIQGAFLLEPEKREDPRGTFARTWCKKESDAQGLSTDFVQFNVSRTKKKGTIRGLHYQIEPHAEAKLIRCMKGRLYDVIVDLRPDSPTFTKWVGIELVEKRSTKKPYPWEEKIGIKVCREVRTQGVILRPLGNVIVLMPPLAITLKELKELLDVTYWAIEKVTGN